MPLSASVQFLGELLAPHLARAIAADARAAAAAAAGAAAASSPQFAAATSEGGGAAAAPPTAAAAARRAAGAIYASLSGDAAASAALAAALTAGDRARLRLLLLRARRHAPAGGTRGLPPALGQLDAASRAGAAPAAAPALQLPRAAEARDVFLRRWVRAALHTAWRDAGASAPAPAARAVARGGLARTARKKPSP